MTDQSIYLSSFDKRSPRFTASQSRTVDFLKEVHRASAGIECATPIEKLIDRYAVKENQIGSRSFECPDVFLSSDDRRLYGAHQPDGANISDRTDFFRKRSLEIIESFYAGEKPPEHLIHVTCTGYASPSAAQLLVAKKNWSTEITHAYHMGCYASLPAVRLGWGQCLRAGSVDIVHNEMCSLHLHPQEHTPEQLVVQTLFADGHIRYRLSKEKTAGAMKVIRIEEKILPDSSQDMTWSPGPTGMNMTLSREVPQKIERELRGFVHGLIERGGYSVNQVLQEGIFAIHPGGPKIIDSVAHVLKLREDQCEASRRILLERGNMSSATLPHVWEMISRKNFKAGTPIISLAFGPGLTMFGSIFEST